jgi:hypothetical protein
MTFEMGLRALLDTNRACGDLVMPPRPQQRAELLFAERFAPAQMGLPFVVPLRLKVTLVAKSFGKEAQKLASASQRARLTWLLRSMRERSEIRFARCCHEHTFVTRAGSCWANTAIPCVALWHSLP